MIFIYNPMQIFSEYLSKSRLAKTNLRTKILFVFVFPLAILMVLTSFLHAIREQQEWREVYKTEATQFAELASRGLRHAMLTNDTAMTERILNNFGKQDLILRVWIVNNDGVVKYSSIATEIGKSLKIFDSGCQACHQFPPESRPRATQLELEGGILRAAIPFVNEEECRACHSAESSHLGVLLVDESLAPIAEEIREDLLINLLISSFSILSIIFVGYFLVSWLVERRIRVIANSLKAFSSGDFSVRIPKNWRTEDEVTRLADSFNQMADSIEAHDAEQKELNLVRQQAILEERERIAHDLHDGIVQVLAYLSKKIGAVRLRIQQNKTQIALKQLDEFEKAISNEVGDVRSTIASLRLIGQEDTQFSNNMDNVIEMCQRMCDFEIDTDVEFSVSQLELNPEVELQLLRILQEVINNTRKHASASRVKVTAKVEANYFVLSIEDNGTGFNPWKRSLWKPPHFGLSSMSERAERIGAIFKLESGENRGTKVTVKVKV